MTPDLSVPGSSGQGYHRAKTPSSKKKKAPAGREPGFRGSDFGKGVLSETADRAYPVVRDVFERGAGGDTAVRIADFRIIDITAGAFILHNNQPPSFIFAPGVPVFQPIPSYRTGDRTSSGKKA